MRAKVKLNTDSKNFMLQVLKGTLVAVSFALILILIFALVIRFASIPDSFIKPINQIIKVASILLGVIVALKSDNTKGLKKGMIIGALFSILSYVTFSLLSMHFSFGFNVIIDLLFAGIIGSICGIMVVNIRK